MNRINQFKENIINIYGEAGKTWLNQLPVLIEEIARYWQLTAITPVNNMTFNYVAKAYIKNTPVIIKISFEKESLTYEKNALAYFNGRGAVKVIDYYEKFNALLLHQILPGITLKSLYPEKEKFVIQSYIKTMKALHFKPSSNDHFSHVNDWLKALDQTTTNVIPKEMLIKAINLKNKLLSSSSAEFVLHGDLHHDNILQSENEWLAIDPKGVIGEPEFEIAAFDFITKSELNNNNNIKNLFDKRCDLICEQSGYSKERIKNWVFVRLILSAIWSIEDNSSPDLALKLALCF